MTTIKKITLPKLTLKEYNVLSMCLSSVEGCMERDTDNALTDFDAYTDGMNFVLSFDNQEMSAFKRLMKKI